jgi:uncharacterized protein (DUF2141 family)
MTKNLKYSAICIILLIVSLGLSQCKSPEAPKETPAVVATIDTVPAADTAAVATKPTTDTVAPQIPLTLIINNLKSPTAPVIVGAYGSDNEFPDPKGQLKEYKFTPNGNQLVAKITNLKFGVYALAIYQDVNSNGKIDKNLIGIPTEPYAFSNNYKPKVKAPNFDNCKFEYDSKSNTVTMNLLK